MNKLEVIKKSLETRAEILAVKYRDLQLYINRNQDEEEIKERQAKGEFDRRFAEIQAEMNIIEEIKKDLGE